ncbi:transposase [Kitasatospora cathayae]|uniref:Transposase n=1 Tax=Kitasatospora cathayae TaxID=3004092 RepID=A0ABY7QB08_9ACTN|nr:transposase [Kitasatospora sp. HUAS 3-15]WBP89928.1 transposase [Kitasatospora sp. HUAS 3-15]
MEQHADQVPVPQAELTTSQRKGAARAFGCARVAYNDGLRLCLEADERGEKIPSTAALSKLVVTDGKKKPGRAWLGEVSAVALQQSVRDLGQAWSNHFASRKGTRRGPKIEQPSFKSKKDHRDAIRFTANARFKITPSGRLRLPGTGEVKVRWSHELPSDPTSITLIRTRQDGSSSPSSPRPNPPPTCCRPPPARSASASD